MGLLVFVAKILLTVLNTVFAMCSLIMVAIGCILFYAGDVLYPFTNILLQQLTAYGVINQPSLDVSGFDIQSIATQIAWPVVMCGAVLFCISFLGCCGANCESKILLIVYSAVLGVVIVVQVLAVIILAGGQGTFKQQIVDQGNAYVVNEYKGDNSSDAFSVLLNIAQMGMKCCGVDSYTKLQTATNWERTGTFYTQDGQSVSGTLEIPFACCNMSQPFPAVAPYDVNCVINLDATTSYYSTSCLTAIENYISTLGLFSWAIVGTLGFIGVQVVILILAILIIVRMGKVNPIV